MTGAGPETEQAELFPTTPGITPQLEPGPSYFDGQGLTDLTDGSRERFGLLGDDADRVTRHSYLYEFDYPTRSASGESEYGKIEFRGLTWNYSQDLPESYWSMVEAAAHRAAQLFDTAIQTARYDGYLTGFQPENPTSVRDPGKMRESEEIAVDEQGAIGAVVWSVEVYDESGRLRGVAQGAAYPWLVASETIPGREAVDITPHKWEIFKNEQRDAYQISAPGRTDARRRYNKGGAGNRKRVHVNGKNVGQLNDEGQTYIKTEYQHGPTYSGGHTTMPQWSREGLIDETAATPQAIRKGGTLYVVGEDESSIYLRTSRALPDGYKAADPEDVSPSLETQEGTPGGERHILDIRGTDDGLPVECRRDERTINALGRSTPEYRHVIESGWFV